jgi:BlaI family transcriptional regulator, penicillinase repressor
MDQQPDDQRGNPEPPKSGPLDSEPPKMEPTKAELEILQVLWAHGPSTVRFVNDRLNEQREVNYTSTLKVMQIMADKGILKRDESQMKHVYSPAEGEQKTKDRLLDKFVDSVYQGAAGQLVMQLLGNKKTSPEDLAAIRKILDNLAAEGGDAQKLNSL